jgi:hypothetical protein
MRKLRLAYLVTHPIQYQAPLLRQVAAQPDIDLTAFFATDFSARSFKAHDFAQQITWDVPLLEGYAHEVLPRLDRGPPEGIEPILGFWSPLSTAAASTRSGCMATRAGTTGARSPPPGAAASRSSCATRRRRSRRGARR